MRTARTISSLLFVLTFALTTESRLVGQDKSDLAPLKNYLGQWDSEFRIINDRSTEPSRVFQGTVTGKWSVGGAFVEQSGRNIIDDKSKPFEFKTMMAFNKKSGNFDFYYFYSSGEVFKGEAHWDPKTKVMTTVRGDDQSQIVEITADFSKTNEENWKIVIREANKQVKFTIEGKNKKRIAN